MHTLSFPAYPESICTQIKPNVCVCVFCINSVRFAKTFEYFEFVVSRYPSTIYSFHRLHWSTDRRMLYVWYTFVNEAMKCDSSKVCSFLFFSSLLSNHYSCVVNDEYKYNRCRTDVSGCPSIALYCLTFLVIFLFRV